MENRFYIKELDSYQKASDLSKERMGTNPNYDLELLPTKQMQEEMWEFLQYRGKNLVAEKILYRTKILPSFMQDVERKKTTGRRVFWTGIKKNGCSR